MAEKTRKRNFSETEVEVLVGEVEARKIILFGGHSSGITNKRKFSEWQHVVSAVNEVSATERSVADIKKKWSDLKVEAKKRVARHRESISATGGGRGTPEPTPLDNKIASILGTASVGGIVSEKEGDTDLAETTEETGKVHFYHFIKCVNDIFHQTCEKVTHVLCPPQSRYSWNRWVRRRFRARRTRRTQRARRAWRA